MGMVPTLHRLALRCLFDSFTLDMKHRASKKAGIYIYYNIQCSTLGEDKVAASCSLGKYGP